MYPQVVGGRLLPDIRPLQMLLYSPGKEIFKHEIR